MRSSEGQGDTVRRADAFLGLHFDLHPNVEDTALGRDVSAENIRELLRRVRPDYVQYDCKGHPGYTGYPTEVGWPSPGILRDALAVWRQVTAEEGVALFIHYSGVLDAVAVEKHPEWARADAQGQRDDRATSVFGPYVDKLMIPQLTEVVDAYDLDGLWVDGECWGVQLDYGPAAMAQWEAETGRAQAPTGPEDPHWEAWKAFHRRAFERYLAHWVDALHAHDPALEITSNWMYTTFAPKPVEVGLDYLSGDYSHVDSVDTARFQARYLANTGMPWDLMAWGFNRHGDQHTRTLKRPLQLQQEASVVLMQGGGFQTYFVPTRAGYLADEIIETAEAVARFCRLRQTLCHKSRSAPQVALLLAETSHWRRSDRVFAPWEGEYDGLEGTLHALLELHYSVDVLAEHQLLPRIDDFPLIVIPDAPRLSAATRRALDHHVRTGGRLLLIGAETAGLFQADLGVRFLGEASERMVYLESPLGLAHVAGRWASVTPITGQVAGRAYPTRDTRRDPEVAASWTAHGQGRIGAIYGPLGHAFYDTHHTQLRAFLGQVVAQLFPDPAVRIDAPPSVDLALRRSADGQLTLHLLNLTNAQRGDRFLSTEFIPPVGPIQVEWRLDDRPQAVRWMPGGRELDVQWRGGFCSVTVPELRIHGMLIVDE